MRPILSMEGCAIRGNVRVTYLICTLCFLWKCVLQREYSNYVFNMHRVLCNGSVCHKENVRVKYLICTVYFLWKCVLQGGTCELCS